VSLDASMSMDASVSVDASVPTLATIYPFPAGEAASERYRVELLDGPAPRETFVYESRARDVVTPGNPGTAFHAGRSTHWTTFESAIPVRVRVTRLDGPLGAVTVRPSRLGVRVAPRDRTSIELEVPPGARLSIEPESELVPCGVPANTCLRAPLLLFADRPDVGSPLAGVPESDIYRPDPGDYRREVLVREGGDSWVGGVAGLPASGPFLAGLPGAEGRRVVVFGPGIHHIGYWEVPASVEHVRIEGGAVVYGAIHATPASPVASQDDYRTWWTLTPRPAFRVSGHGVLSGRDIPWHLTQDFGYCAGDDCGWWRMIRLLRLDAQRVEVDDVTLVDAPYWVTDFRNGNDNSVRATFDGIKILGQWAHNTDGLSLTTESVLRGAFIQTNDDAVKLVGSRARLEDTVFWHFGNGATFQLGWYPRSFDDVVATGIDVIHAEWWFLGGDNGGFVSFPSITASGTGEIRALRFEDVRMEGPVLRLIGLATSTNQRISGLTFRDVRVDRWGNDAYGSGIFNRLDASVGAIDDLSFEGLVVGGVAIDDANYVRDGAFDVVGPVSSLRFLP
jgi:hypothetical protein